MGDGRFILLRRCVGVTPHLCVSSVLFHQGDPSSSDSALIKARVRKNRIDSGHWSNDCETEQRCLGNLNTADVNNVIYWCHLEKIGPKGASVFASSLCYMWGDPLPCLFAQLSLGRRIGLYSGGLRGEPTQTVLLKLDFWYIPNNNGFTRQEFFLSPSHNLFIFQKLKPDPQRGARLFCCVCSEREEGSRPDQYLSELQDTYIVDGEGTRERERENLQCLLFESSSKDPTCVRDGVKKLVSKSLVCPSLDIFWLLWFVAPGLSTLVPTEEEEK